MRSSFIHLHLFGKPVAAHSAPEDVRDRAYDQVRGRRFPGRALLRFGPVNPAHFFATVNTTARTQRRPSLIVRRLPSS